MTPQTILILLCAAAAVLLLIRLSIGGSGRRLRSPDVGSSMTIGGREVQEDVRWHAGYTDGPSRRPGGWDGKPMAHGSPAGRRLRRSWIFFGIIMRLTIPSTISGNPSMRLNRAILRELGDEGYGAASVGVAMIRENWLFLRRCGKCQAMRVQKRRPGAGIRRPHPGCAGGTVVPDRQALPGGRAGHAGKPPAL